MPKSADRRRELSDPAPPYLRTSRYATKIISHQQREVSRASHCHHTPQAFRPHSGPVTRPIRPNSTASSAAATAMRSAARRSLEQIDRARDAADDDRREHREPRGHVEVENLLHQPHRRLVRARASDRRTARATAANIRRRRGAHNAACNQLSFTSSHSVISGSNVHSASVTNTTSNAARIADPHDRGRLVRRRLRAARPCRALPQ